MGRRKWTKPLPVLDATFEPYCRDANEDRVVEVKALAGVRTIEG